MAARIHITGAPGSGVSTLGEALAQRLGARLIDTDDVYWLPTDPPYREKRPVENRLAILRTAFEAAPDGWILSGSGDSWIGPITPLFDLVVFVEAPTDVRLERLARREAERFGAEACAPGGAWHEDYKGFLEWASRYEHGDREGRSRARHEAWLKTLACPHVRVDGRWPPAELVQAVLAILDGPRRDRD